ncbi:protein DMP3-like [Curcuma longa]|uniref:protein DMP3-like n=1 Tax=Curcuma longa TaxID=136217 RepID=UPI003D9E7922
MAASSSSASASPASNKTLSVIANLAQLLPTGTVLAFQALAPSFANRGACYTSNKVLTAVLIAASAASAAFFSFTDSFTGRDGKLYYGVATRGGFYVFNYDSHVDDGGAEAALGDLRRYRLRAADYVHAFLAVLLFLTVAFSDGMIQNCLFPAAGKNTRELVVNLPLGAAVLSTLVFTLFPTTRQGIGYTNATQSKSIGTA